VVTAILIADRGLLATDGTATGTVLLKAAQWEEPRFWPINRTAVLGGRVVFVAQDRGYNQLWITDGTSAGTTLVAALPTSDLMEGVHAQVRSLISLGDRVIFSYTNGDSPTAPGMLWVTDGTAAGTQLLTDQTSLHAASARLDDGRLIFVGDGLYATDGTVAGTVRLVPPSIGFQLNANLPMASVGSLVLFQVVFQAGLGLPKTNQLWATDGTTAGTVLVAPLEGNAADATPRWLSGFGTRAFFEYLGALWVSDGTAGGTLRLPDVGFPVLDSAALVDGRAVFLSTKGVGASDGTVAGTALVVANDPATGFAVDTEVGLARVGGEVLFTLRAEGGRSKQVWAADGAAGGLRLVATLPYSDAAAGVFALASLGERALISAIGDDGKGVLWGSDGTAAGTGPVQADFLTALGEVPQVPCFVKGTRIRTARGEVPVEALVVGDLVFGARSGRMRAVVWVGQRRVVTARHRRPGAVWPVCVRAGAIGPGVPARDVWLSPEHGVFVHGVLVPVRLLANGVSIVQRAWAEVTYCHVELEAHDLVVSEGLLSESYLDTGNRADFADGSVVNAYPAFGAGHASQVWAEQACAPQLREGPALAAIRSALADRSREMAQSDAVAS
jgi:ELWxxDGT repeat protein